MSIRDWYVSRIEIGVCGLWFGRDVGDGGGSGDGGG